MKNSLEKQAKRGDIEYIQAGERIFYVRNLQNGKLSIIFYDNKYRQDTLDKNKAIAKLEKQIDIFKSGEGDIGIYNTDVELRRLRTIKTFLED